MSCSGKACGTLGRAKGLSRCTRLLCAGGAWKSCVLQPCAELAFPPAFPHCADALRWFGDDSGLVLWFACCHLEMLEKTSRISAKTRITTEIKSWWLWGHVECFQV